MKEERDKNILKANIRNFSDSQLTNYLKSIVITDEVLTAVLNEACYRIENNNIGEFKKKLIEEVNKIDNNMMFGARLTGFLYFKKEVLDLINKL